MNQKPLLPQVVIEAYPQLVVSDLEHIGRFTPKVPVSPDRIYDIYKSATNNTLLTHVTADYPDPLHDASELVSISSGYGFKELITPGDNNSTISVVDNDDMTAQFFVKDNSTYHYVAITEYAPGLSSV